MKGDKIKNSFDYRESLRLCHEALAGLPGSQDKSTFVLEDLFVFGFDHTAYKGKDLVDALKTYIDELIPYADQIQQAAYTREDHYDTFIACCGRVEKPGQKLVRVALNVIKTQVNISLLKAQLLYIDLKNENMEEKRQQRYKQYLKYTRKRVVQRGYNGCTYQYLMEKDDEQPPDITQVAIVTAPCLSASQQRLRKKMRQRARQRKLAYFEKFMAREDRLTMGKP